MTEIKTKMILSEETHERVKKELEMEVLACYLCGDYERFDELVMLLCAYVQIGDMIEKAREDGLIKDRIEDFSIEGTIVI